MMCAGYVHLDAAMDNIVASPGGTIRIKCEITGYPLPRYVWYKDDVAVDSADDDSTAQTRFNIKTTPWGSRSARLMYLSLKLMIPVAIFLCGYWLWGKPSSRSTI